MGARSRKRLVRLRVIQLYKEIAVLTKPECENVCGPKHVRKTRCCEALYCETAIEHARKKWSVELPRTNHPELPLMGPDGCTAEPHLRPICAVHTCEVNNLGCKVGDPAWTRKYMKLRNEITELDITIALADL